MAAIPSGSVAQGRQGARGHAGSWLIWLATMMLLAFGVDPTDSGLGLPLTFQFLPAILALMGGFAFLLGGVRMEGGLRWEDLGFLVVVAMTFYGGFATVLVFGEPADSFLRLGLSALSYIPYRMLAAQPAQLDWFFRMICGPIWIVGIAITLMLLYWALVGPFVERPRGIHHIFHEEVYLLAVATVLAALSIRKRPVLGIALVVFFLVGQIFTFKNTGFLTALLTLFYLAIIPAAWLGVRGAVLGVSRFMGVLYVLLLMVMLGLLFPYLQDSLPDGSAHVRLYTYGIRWQQFLEAPLVGQLFYGSPLIAVPSTNLVIPSHSDVMDLLAYGGMLGALCFILPALSLFFWIGRLRHLQQERHLAMVMHVMTFTLAIVMTFNPVWLQPKMGGFLWMGLAILVGIRARQGRGGWPGVDPQAP